MSNLVFDAESARNWQTGVDHVCVAVGTGKLVPWNGVSSITESPEGAEITPVYADNIKYLNLVSAEDFKASIECYSYPDEFKEALGISTPSGAAGLSIPQQTRKTFGMMFRTKKITGDVEDYVYHFIWNCRVGVSDSQYQTINDSPEAMTFSWDIETLPYTGTGTISGVKSFAHLTVDTSLYSSSAKATVVGKLEALFNDATVSGAKAGVGMPTPAEVQTAATAS